MSNCGKLRLSMLMGCAFLQLLTTCAGHLILKDGMLGIGLPLDKFLWFFKKNSSGCTSENFTCACGQRGTPLTVPIPHCGYAHRWTVYCKPCFDLKPKDVCPLYRRCRQCHINGGNSCASCPIDKFGTWCENTCTCQNGGVCDRNGKCICPPKYSGRNCEKKEMCPAYVVVPPLQVSFEPRDNPLSAVFTCQPDFVLEGKPVSTCVNGKWSSKPPTCRPKCPLLSAPANGRLTFSGSDLVMGVTAEVECKPSYRLVGEKTLICAADGKWSNQVPICEEMASCQDPGDVQHAERTILPHANNTGYYFLQDSEIQYNCQAGFEQMGATKIFCRFDGKWSDKLPSCLKVATVVPDCKTPGSDVTDEEGVLVRILCPPNCVEEEFKVWGTSIYRAGSSVCQAAIHSAKITNSGGSVAVINSGPYSHFMGSRSGYIVSESYPERDESFRFDRLSVLSLPRNGDCEIGLMRLETTCVYVSNLVRNNKDAKAVCTNLGLHLAIPADPEERLRLLTILNSKGIRSIWTDDKLQMVLKKEDKNATGETPLTSEDFYCRVANIDNLEFKSQRKLCRDFANYVCILKSNFKSLAVCRDPGLIANGTAKSIGQIDNVFYVGSSIEYSCQTLHYLKGEKTIFCTTNGTWSAKKPECIKVDACESPPIPLGGSVTFLPPVKSSSAERTTFRHSQLPQSSRGVNFRIGLAASIPLNFKTSATQEPGTILLPPNLYRKGTQAMYDCVSRYYNFIGPRMRICQGMGEWSGRPPMCVPVCGRSDSPRSPFITNGNATEIGQWPWQAGIDRYVQGGSSPSLICGATLVNELWVITAAHCVTYPGTTLTIEPDSFQVYLGKYYRTDSKDDEHVQVRKIREIHIHPDYEPYHYDADIAVIQLDSPVRLNSRVQPVCLPTEQTTRKNVVPGNKGVVTGWGANENELLSETLQQAVLPVVSHETCEKGYEYSKMPATVTDNMFCAGFEHGRSNACKGDSGGPMVFLDKSTKDRRWVLEGIVSWGSTRGCRNPKQYAGFTTVSRFLDWIHLYF